MSQSAVAVMPLLNGTGHMPHPGSSKDQTREKILQYFSEMRLDTQPFSAIPSSLFSDAARLLRSGTTLPRDAASVSTTHGNSNSLSQPATAGKTSFIPEVPLREPTMSTDSSFTPVKPTQSHTVPTLSLKDNANMQQQKTAQQTKIAGTEDQVEPREPLLRYLNVGELLDQALQKVPHVSAFNPATAAVNEANDSFSDKSLYSSEVWSPTAATAEKAAEEQSTGSDMMDISDDGEIYEPTQQIVNAADASNSDQASYNNEDAEEEEYEPYVPDRAPDAYEEADMFEYADDEGDDYSPPPPESRRQLSSHSSGQPNAFRGFEPPPMADGYYSRRGRPQHHKRQNEQPSASTRSERRRGQGAVQRRNGQEDFRQNLHVQKRRRQPADRENGQRAAGKRKAISPRDASPEVFIKPEPVSPPPFSFDDTPPSRNDRRATGLTAGDVDMESPQLGRRPSGYQSGYESTYDDYASASNGYEASSLRSPALIRRPQRDDQNLRRVASLQHAQRPRSPEPDAGTYRHNIRPNPLLDQQESRVKPTPITKWTRLGETVVDGQVVPVIQTDYEPPESPPRVLFVDQHGKPYYNKPPKPAPVIVNPSRKRPYVEYDDNYLGYVPEPVFSTPARALPAGNQVYAGYPRAATQQPLLHRQGGAHGNAEDQERMPPPQLRRPLAYTDANVGVEPRQRAYSMHPLQATSSRDVDMPDPFTQQYDPARPATSFRDAPYAQRTTSEYISRTYSVRPETDVRQDAAPYPNVVPTPSEPIAPSLPQADSISRAYSVRPDMAAPRGSVAPHSRQPSAYNHHAMNENTYPTRAYSTVAPSEPRNRALDELRTRYDPAPAAAPVYPTYASTSMPPHARTFSDEATIASNHLFASGSRAGYTYR